MPQQRTPWATSDRAQRLPREWKRIRAAVRRRAGGRCQGPTDPDTGHPSGVHPRCPEMGTECDHIVPGDDHSLDNLQWLCEQCHAEKTRQEAARAAKAWRAKTKRPKESHPGLTEAG